MTDESAENLPEIIEPSLPVAGGNPAAVGTGVSVGNITDMSMAQLDEHLAALDAKRDRIQEWLYAHFTRGVHYGIPPGCGPGEISEDGYYETYTKKGGKQRVHISQYKPKDSLYKAGASLACDLFGVTVRAMPDDTLNAISNKGDRATFTFRTELCKGDIVAAVGVGSCSIGEKGFDSNQAMKQAKKRSLVDAVLQLPFMADLFEAEEFQPPPKDAPEMDPSAPDHTPTRDERKATGFFATKDFQTLWHTYEAIYPKRGKVRFLKDCSDIVKADMKVESKWTLDAVTVIRESLQAGD